jgi:hypothetical protein
MVWTDKQRHIYLVIAVLGLLIGLIGGFLVGDARGQTLGTRPAPSRTLASAASVQPAGTSSGPAVSSTARLICRDDPPEYPGCTPAQARQREAATRRMTRRHYNANRWGQSHHEFRGLRPAANRKLRRLYHHAVLRFVERHTRAGVTTANTYPRYRTWRGFKAHTACSGVFGWGSVMPYGWCQVGQAYSGWGEAARDTERMTLKCDGLILGAAGSGAAVAGWTGVAILPGALIGGGGASVGCAVESIWDSLWSW